MTPNMPQMCKNTNQDTLDFLVFQLGKTGRLQVMKRHNDIKLPCRARVTMVTSQHRALHPRAVHQDAGVGLDQVLAVIEGVHLKDEDAFHSLLKFEIRCC